MRGLANRLAAQRDVPIEFWGWAGEQPLEIAAPHSALWLPRIRMPEYRGAWIFAQFAMKRSASQSTVRAVHITDPDALTTLGNRTVMTTVYDLIPFREGISPRRVLAWAGYRAYLGMLRRASTLFAISNQTASDITNLLGVPPARIVLVPPGIEPQTANAAPRDNRRPYFLFIGGPNPNKNLSTLLDAMAISTELEEELVITGHWLPKQLAGLNANLRNSGLHQRVHHLGFVPASDLPGLMHDATALIIPSRDEGFGLPVGEGLAAGAVVIHSRIPVMHEVSGGAALTFDAGSADELAARMRQVARDETLREGMRERGRERAQHLTWDAGVKRTLETYEAVLKG